MLNMLQRQRNRPGEQILKDDTKTEDNCVVTQENDVITRDKSSKVYHDYCKTSVEMSLFAHKLQQYGTLAVAAHLHLLHASANVIWSFSLHETEVFGLYRQQ